MTWHNNYFNLFVVFNLYSFYNVRLNIVNIVNIVNMLFLHLKYAILRPTYYFYLLFVRFVLHSNVKRRSSTCKSLYMGDQVREVRGQRSESKSQRVDSHKAKRHTHSVYVQVRRSKYYVIHAIKSLALTIKILCCTLQLSQCI